MIKIAIRHLSIPLVFLMLLFSVACNKSTQEPRPLPNNLSAYVYAFTSGVISKDSPVRVRFASSVAQGEDIGQEAPALISFSPSIQGSFSWEDEQTLLFEPQEALTSGESYVASVNMNSLFDDLPSEAQSFDFTFSVKEQYVNVEIEGFYMRNAEENAAPILKGKVFTADLADPEEISSLLQAQQGNNNLNIRWENAASQQVHPFVIEGISRGNSASEVDVSWNGKSLGVKSKGDKTVEVPAIGDFRVMDSKVVTEGDAHIVLYFSNPLKADQNLDGLVRINGYSGTIRHLIDGNQLRIYTAGRLVGNYKVVVDESIRNLSNERMHVASEWEINIADAKPQLELLGQGVIMPTSDGLIFPFKAISLNAVEVEIFKIYNNNILQFLQSNELDGNYELYRVGKTIMRQKVGLNQLNPQANSTQWMQYALDLSKLVEADDQAIYQIRIGFRPAYSSYFCSESNSSAAISSDDLQQMEDASLDQSIMDSWYGIDGWYDGYRWTPSR